MVAGHWNIPIFSPDWVHSHLTAEQHIGLGVDLFGAAQSARLEFENIYLTVGTERLQVAPNGEPSDQLLEKMEKWPAGFWKRFRILPSRAWESISVLRSLSQMRRFWLCLTLQIRVDWLMRGPSVGASKSTDSLTSMTPF